MVALKCKKCGSYDISATDEGFICEECKAFYHANEMADLVEKESEVAPEQQEAEKEDFEIQDNYEIQLSQPLNAKQSSKIITPKVVLIIAAVLCVVFFTVMAWLVLYPVICSARADKYLESGNYIKAYQYYEYADDKDGMSSATYRLADYYVSQGWFEPAYECYERINDENGMKTICYQWAEQSLDIGEKAQAAVLFGKAIGYLDAKERSFRLWNDIAVRTEGAESSFFIPAFDMGNKAWITDNGVKAEGENYSEGTVLEGWDDVISIVFVGDEELVGLRKDGTLISTSGKYDDYENVVGIYCYLMNSLIILKADGTTELEGVYGGSLFDTEDIIFIYEGDIALKADGTVVAAGDFSSYVQNWSGVIDITATTEAVFALKSDGTVLSADKQGNSVSTVSGWKNIKNIASYGEDLIGLKTDGTLVCTDEEWSRIDKTGVEDIYDTSGGIILITRENGSLYVNW